MCFTFSRAIEDITTTEMLYKGRETRENFFLGLINFCIKPLSSHIWFLQRGAQLGPRCMCVRVVILMHSDGDFLIKQLHWDADRDTQRKRLHSPNNADSWQKGLCGLFNTLELNQHSLLTTELAISSDFSAWSAEQLHVQMSFRPTLEKVSARADGAVLLCLCAT